ncbi:hypothetical protein [Komagataeibacter sp. FXV3]|uniref:hypothetical protein n=1 Tax=Komagataeibacter sp. FXV3 TaxID=2608998 RepID=UPI00187B9C6E|nr:hypothetical protein [Komagataeibacter sp. FXV3]MBE7731422.1 hypothetical protein [Komagataeibacter sp. FXV3]
MRDFIIGIGAISAATTGIAALTACGFFHDDNFSNPQYAACMRSGYASPVCMRRIQTMHWHKPETRRAGA